MNNGIPVGAIMAFASTTAPEGWLICDGSELKVSHYKDLFDYIGTLYGGDGVSTFCLPDLQGMFIRGLDLDGLVDPEREVGSFQEDSFQGHEHAVKSCSNEGRHFHYIGLEEYPTYERDGIFSTTYHHKHLRDYENSSKHCSSDHDGSHVHQIEIGNPISSNYGVVDSHVKSETRPKNIALLYCIKAL